MSNTVQTLTAIVAHSMERGGWKRRSENRFIDWAARFKRAFLITFAFYFIKYREWWTLFGWHGKLRDDLTGQGTAQLWRNWTKRELWSFEMLKASEDYPQMELWKLSLRALEARFKAFLKKRHESVSWKAWEALRKSFKALFRTLKASRLRNESTSQSTRF